MPLSFIKRLTKKLRTDLSPDQENFLEEELEEVISRPSEDNFEEPDAMEGQLAVDVYDQGEFIYVKAMIAGVKKNDLDINLKRESITIRGERFDQRAPGDDSYVYQELYWGAFSRVINLPEEVDIDLAKASDENGLLTIKLPKIDRERSTRLSIEADK